MILVWICAGFLLLSICLLVMSIYRSKKKSGRTSFCFGFLAMFLMAVALCLMCVFNYFTLKQEAKEKIPELMEQRQYLLWQMSCLNESTPDSIFERVADEVASFNQEVSQYRQAPYSPYNGFLHPKDYGVIKLLPELSN